MIARAFNQKETRADTAAILGKTNIASNEVDQDLGAVFFTEEARKQALERTKRGLLSGLEAKFTEDSEIMTVKHTFVDDDGSITTTVYNNDGEILSREVTIEKLYFGPGKQGYPASSLADKDEIQAVHPSGTQRFVFRILLGREQYDVALGDLEEHFYLDLHEFGLRSAQILYYWGAIWYVPRNLANKLTKAASAVLGYVTGLFI